MKSINFPLTFLINQKSLIAVKKIHTFNMISIMQSRDKTIHSYKSQNIRDKEGFLAFMNMKIQHYLSLSDHKNRFLKKSPYLIENVILFLKDKIYS